MLVKYSSKQIEKTTRRYCYMDDAKKIYYHTGRDWTTIVTDKIPYVAPNSEFTQTGFISIEPGNCRHGDLPLPLTEKGCTATVAGTRAGIGIMQKSGGNYQKAWFIHALAPDQSLEAALAELGKPGSDKVIEAVIMMTGDNANDLLPQYQKLLEKALGRACDVLILWEASWPDFAMVFRGNIPNVPIGSFGHLYLQEELWLDEYVFEDLDYLDPNKTKYFYGMNRQEFRMTKEFGPGEPIHDSMQETDNFSSFYLRIYRTQKEEYIDAAKLYNNHDPYRLRRGNLGYIVQSKTPQVIHAEGLPFFWKQDKAYRRMGSDVLMQLNPNRNVDWFVQPFEPGKGRYEETLVLPPISNSPICIYIFLKEGRRYTMVYRIWTWDVAGLEAVDPAIFIQPVPDGRKEVLVIARPERENDAMRALVCLEEKMPLLKVDSHTLCWFTRTADVVVSVSPEFYVYFGCHTFRKTE